MGQFGSFIKGALLGGLIGSVVATILAPESGASLQERLRRQARQVVDEARLAAAARRAELEAELHAATQETRPPEPPGSYYS